MARVFEVGIAHLNKAFLIIKKSPVNGGLFYYKKGSSLEDIPQTKL